MYYSKKYKGKGGCGGHPSPRGGGPHLEKANFHYLYKSKGFFPIQHLIFQSNLRHKQEPQNHFRTLKTLPKNPQIPD